MIAFASAADLQERIGQEVAVSDWIEVSQARIDRFADATDDHQWIHVDPGRAVADSPFKAPVAHGFLTLSLVSALTRNAVAFSGRWMAVNYGLNRVRFVLPVPAGSRIRARITPLTVAEADSGIQVTWSIVVELELGARPACVAEWLVRYHRQ